MNWLWSVLFKNNGSGTPSRTLDASDFFDALQVAGYGALVAGLTAAQAHLEASAESYTGVAALVAAVLMFGVKLALNYFSNNEK